MPKVNLDKVSVITFVRVDTEERVNNLKIISNYMRSQFDGLEMIYVEDDVQQKLPNMMSFQKGDMYGFYHNDSAWNKCRAYNLGARMSTRDILLFLDADVILHKDAILTSFKNLTVEPTIGLVYPYSGLFLCVNLEKKREFEKTLDYGYLAQFFPSRQVVGHTENGIEVVHTKSFGGAVMAHRDTYMKFGGHNPNFRGWGFEDDEVPKRVSALGYKVMRIQDHPVWHLEQFDNSVPIPQNVRAPYHAQNMNIYMNVCRSNKEQMEAYIKGWRV